MNENENWQKHAIRSAHQSTGRKSKDQLPDVICTQEYAEKIAEEYLKKNNCRAERKSSLCKGIVDFYVVQCERYSQDSSYEQDDTSFASS